MNFFKITVILLSIRFLLVLAKDDHIHLQRRTLTPSNPGGGNGHHHGDKIPVPSANDRINRGIRIREPVDQHPELPRNHPNRPYSAAIRPPRNRNQKEEDKGKGKMKEDEEQIPRKKRKADKMTHDREASTSRAKKSAPAPAPPTSSPPSGTYDYGYKTRAQRKSEAEAIGTVLGVTIGITSPFIDATYQAGKRAYRKMKDTCNEACLKAKQKAKQIRLRVLGPKHRTRPLQRYRPKPRDDSEGSSEVGIVKKNGRLRHFVPVNRGNSIEPVNARYFRYTLRRRPLRQRRRSASPSLSPRSSGTSNVYTSSWSDPVPDHPTSSSKTPPKESKPSASSGNSSVNDQKIRSKGKQPQSIKSTTSDASSSSSSKSSF